MKILTPFNRSHHRHPRLVPIHIGNHAQRQKLAGHSAANSTVNVISLPHSQSYHIEYRHMTLDDQVDIDISLNEWVAETIEHPFLFDHKGQRHILYNGYGKTGFGLAVLEQG